MRHLKHFKKVIDSDLTNMLERFYKNFNYYKTQTYNRTKDIAKLYKVPNFAHDEFEMLYFLYNCKYEWRTDIPRLDEYVKKTIKKVSLQSLIKKFDDDIENYISLKKTIDDRKDFANSNSYEYIQQATILYIFFLLKMAVDKAPKWIKDSEKYNL